MLRTLVCCVDLLAVGVSVTDVGRERVRFVEVGPDHMDALARLFERNAHPSITKMFNPFSLTVARAHEIAMRPRRDIYYGASLGACLLALSMLRGFDDGYEIPSFGVLVDRENKERGIGSSLTQWTIEQARQQGCRAVRLTVYADNALARSMFTAVGFRETGRQTVERAGETAEKIVMRLDLEG